MSASFTELISSHSVNLDSSLLSSTSRPPFCFISAMVIVIRCHPLLRLSKTQSKSVCSASSRQARSQCHFLGKRESHALATRGRRDALAPAGVLHTDFGRLPAYNGFRSAERDVQTSLFTRHRDLTFSLLYASPALCTPSPPHPSTMRVDVTSGDIDAHSTSPRSWACVFFNFSTMARDRRHDRFRGQQQLGLAVSRNANFTTRT